MLKASRSEKEAGDLLGTYLLQGWVIVYYYSCIYFVNNAIKDHDR